MPLKPECAALVLVKLLAAGRCKLPQYLDTDLVHALRVPCGITELLLWRFARHGHAISPRLDRFQVRSAVASICNAERP